MLSDSNLLFGHPETLAGILGVSSKTVQRYQRHPDKMPEPCRRLLRVHVAGDLASMLGRGWEGFRIGADGLLYVPGWANGFTPAGIRAMFFVFQEAAALRQEVKRLRVERLGAGHDTGARKVLRELVGLQVSNDSDGTDTAHGDVLAASHVARTW